MTTDKGQAYSNCCQHPGVDLDLKICPACGEHCDVEYEDEGMRDPFLTALDALDEHTNTMVQFRGPIDAIQWNKEHDRLLLEAARELIIDHCKIVVATEIRKLRAEVEAELSELRRRDPELQKLIDSHMVYGGTK